MTARPLTLAAPLRWIERGWGVYRRSWRVSSTYAGVAAAVGAAGIAVLLWPGLHVMVFPWLSAFMLVGPTLLIGFFAIAARVREGRPARLHDVLDAWRAAPPALWALAAVAMFLVMIWLTDAALLYVILFERPPVLWLWTPTGVVVSAPVIDFLVGGTIVGAVLAVMIFTTTAFAVPLIYFQRCSLVGAVVASIRTVLANPLAMLLWAALLSVGVLGSLLALPLFVIVFPVFAYAGEAGYREAFDDGVTGR